MKKSVVPINEKINIKHLPDRSDLAGLYYVPKNTSNQSPSRQAVRVKTISVFTAAMGITLPLATITAITVYMFRTPLDHVPFVFIFFIFLVMFILIGVLYVSYHKLDSIFEKMSISIKSLLVTTAIIVLGITFLLYTFILKYLGEFKLIIFLLCIDVAGAIVLTSAVKIINRNR